MLGVRGLDLSHLQNPTWVNTHLEFTHGYGVVMNPVNEIASGGLPHFFMKDIPDRHRTDAAGDLFQPVYRAGLVRPRQDERQGVRLSDGRLERPLRLC